jgi:rhamnose utilization protein RhaD (predicted bifunctional aldolase and dehydrogenase)
VLIPDVGAFTIGYDPDLEKAIKQADNAGKALIDTLAVLEGARPVGGMRSLDYKHQFYIANWAAEDRRERRAAAGR